MFATVGFSGLFFQGLRPSAVRNMARVDIPEVIAMKVSGHKTQRVRPLQHHERDLAEAARKIELSYRQARIAETQQDAEETKQEEPATIQ